MLRYILATVGFEEKGAWNKIDFNWKQLQTLFRNADILTTSRALCSFMVSKREGEEGRKGKRTEMLTSISGQELKVIWMSNYQPAIFKLNLTAWRRCKGGLQGETGCSQV